MTNAWQREALFGGVGTVTVHDLLGKQDAPPFTAVLHCELAPGGSVGRHRQEHFPEVVLCLGGAGVAQVDGTAHTLAPGALVYLPLGSVLALENHSTDEPLRYLIVKASAPSAP